MNDTKIFDEAIEGFKNESPTKELDTRFLQEMDVTDGKERNSKDEQIKQLRELEELLGTKQMNPFGTLDLATLEENLSEMTQTDLQALAVRVGLPPSRDRLSLKDNIKKEFKNFLRHQNLGGSLTQQPIIDPSSPNYKKAVKLFSEGL